MRYSLLLSLLLLGSPVFASTQVSIGISVGSYPHFVSVPGYPVYYAPDVSLNFFFYDGLYWVYQDDRWYSSYWYDGPWDVIDPYYVPYYVLQVPVRYYRRPPPYFRGWQSERAPRWGDHWGRDWEQRRQGWDRPLRQVAPAPLPDYQRQYRGSSYPRVEQQRELRDRNYRYQPQSQQQRQEPQRPQQQLQPRQEPSRPAQQQQPRQEQPRPQQQPPPRQEPQRQQQPTPRASAPSPRQPDARPAGKTDDRPQGRNQDERKQNGNERKDDRKGEQRGRDH